MKLAVPLRSPAARGSRGRSRALAAAAVACLAIGTAAVTALLTLAWSTLLRPLPFPAAERLSRVWLAEPANPRLDLSYPLLRAIAEEVDAFAAVEGTARVRLLVLGSEGGRRAEGEGVTAGYFRLLGLQPAAGRFFTAEEHAAGTRGVAVVGEALARERFGSAAAAVGEQVRTSEGPLTVVGVAPAGFTGTVEDDAGEIEVWLPIDAWVAPARRERWDVGAIWAIGRLRDGVTPAAAAAQLEALGSRLAREHPAVFADRRLTVEPLAENWRSGLRRGTRLLLGGAAVLLAIAVLNVAALLLARSLERSRSRALQRALGAPGWALLRGVLADTALLMALGGALGAVLGVRALPWLLPRVGIVLPDYVQPTADLAIAVGVALVLALAGLVAAAAPAAAALRADPAAALRHGARGGEHGRSGRRAWAALVTAEIALATTLTFGALVLARSAQALAGEHLGFRTAGVVRFGVFGVGGAEAAPADRLAAWRRIRAGVAARPEVEAAALMWPTIPIWGAIEEPVRWAGMPPAERDRGLRAGVFAVDGGFFAVTRVALLAGRRLADDEPAGAGVAVVSQALAERLGGTAAAVGRELLLADGAVTVVGVVADARLSGARDEAESNRYTLYLPLAEVAPSYVSLLAAVRGDAEAAAAPLSREIGRLAPDAALDWVGTLPYWLGQRYLDTRFAPVLSALFAGAALLVAGIGVFALAAAGVTRRRRELGVRLAVGATPRRVAALVVSEGLTLAAAGVALGALAAWPAAGLLADLLYRVPPRDPWSLLGAAAALLALASLATALPARRAARVDPAISLRPE